MTPSSSWLPLISKDGAANKETLPASLTYVTSSGVETTPTAFRSKLPYSKTETNRGVSLKRAQRGSHSQRELSINCVTESTDGHVSISNEDSLEAYKSYPE